MPFKATVIALGRLALLWAASVLLGVYTTLSVSGQGTANTWAEPINISGDTPGGSFLPVVVADPFGYVHVFWEEQVDLGQGVQGGYLFYTQWDSRRWSTPVDILLSPGDYSIVRTPHAAVDPTTGMLHVIWAGGGNLYHSRARVDLAYSAQGWSTPTVVAYGPLQDPYLLVHKGRLHLVYLDNGDDPGIWYTVSTDGGTTWRTPVRLSTPPATRKVLPTVSETVQMQADGQGHLHVVWVDRLDGGIYYARGLHGGDAWESPIRLDDQGTWPSVGILGNEVHVLWSATHEGGPSCARWERISSDGGASWGDRTRVLPPIEGCLGWMNMEVDSAGVMYVVTIGRDDRGIVRLYYARWLGHGWSTPEAIESTAVEHGEWQERGPDRARTALQDGNRLHVVWYTNDGEVWYTAAKLDAPLQRIMPLPPPPLPTATSAPVTPTGKGTAEAMTPTPLPSFAIGGVSSPSSESIPVLVITVLIPSGFSLVAILIAVIVIQVKRNRVG